MKKIINVLICISLVLSSFTFPVFASEAATADYDVPREAGLVEYLKIMSPHEDGGYWDKSVTRGEFAKYVYNTAKSYDSYEKAAYYTDVAKGSELETAVNYLVKAGVLTVSDDRLFRPDDSITFYEVCKMLACIAGYEPFAQYKGGYPAGYIKVINDLHITDGVKNPDTVTNRTAAIMIYNTLLANTYDLYAITQDGPSYTGKNTERVIEKYFDIYTAEGVVTAKDMIDLNSESRADKGIIEIDGVVYNDLTESKELLGYYVNAYVLDNESGKDSVVYAEISDSNKILSIDAKDIKNAAIDAIEYYDGSGKVKTARLSDAVFVKNGSVIGYDIPKETKIQKGCVTLISSSGSSSYDTVIITEYEIFVVGMLDSTNKKIYDKYDRANCVNLNEEKLESAEVLLNGIRANFMHIEDNDVLTVKRSKDGETVTAVISNEFKEGVVDSIGGKPSDKITVDGEEYTLDAKLAKRLGMGISGKRPLVSPGDKVELVFDLTGEVAEIRKSENESFKTGYVHDMGMNKGGLSPEAGIAVYTIEGENKIFFLEDKVSVNDGSKTSTYKDVFNALGKAEDRSVLKPQLIRFAVNGKGKIYAINTADYSTSMAKSRYISRTLDDGKYTYRSNLVYPLTVLDSETVIIQVPTDTVIEEDGRYENYFANIQKSAFKTGGQYIFEAYNLDDDDPYTDVLIYKCTVPSDESQYDTSGVVRSVQKTVDGFGDEVFAVQLFEKGKGVKHMVSTDCIWKDENKNDITPGDLCEGDMIRYSFDGAGSIAYIKLVYRPSDHTAGETLSGMTGSYDARFRLMAYYAADKYEGSEMDSGGTLSLITFSSEFGGAPAMRMQYSRLKKAIVYDGSKREGDRVYIGNIDNIITYNGTGGASASVILTQASIGSVQTFYIIN